MKYHIYRVMYNQKQLNGLDEEFVAAHRVESWTNDYAFFASEASPKAVSRLIPRDRVFSVAMSEQRTRAQMIAEISADLLHHGCSYIGRAEAVRHRGQMLDEIAREAGADKHGWVKSEGSSDGVAQDYAFYSMAKLTGRAPLPAIG